MKTDEAAGNSADFTWSNIPQLPHGKPAKVLSGKGMKHLIKPQWVRAEISASTTCPYITQFRIDCLPRISVERVKKEHLIKSQGVGIKYQLPPFVPISLSSDLCRLLVKDLSEKGEAGKPIPSLVPIFLLSSMDLLII